MPYRAQSSVEFATKECGHTNCVQSGARDHTTSPVVSYYRLQAREQFRPHEGSNIFTQLQPTVSVGVTGIDGVSERHKCQFGTLEP